MAQSLYVFGAQLTKFGVPSLNRGLGDVVLSRNENGRAILPGAAL
jgi:hypothetical protein